MIHLLKNKAGALVVFPAFAGLLLVCLSASAVNPCFPVSSPAVPGTRIQTLVTADFYREDRISLAALLKDEPSLQILRSDGAGSFQLAETIAVPGSALALAAADLNADGWIDLIVTNPSDRSLLLLLRSSEGVCSSNLLPNLSLAPHLLVTGDFNQDQNLDLVMADSSTNRLQVLWGNGVGGFSNVQQFELDSSPSRLIPGDFNGDHQLDLVTLSTDGLHLTVLMSDNTAPLARQRREGIACRPGLAAAADFNRDEKLDLALVSSEGAIVWIMRGNGDGSFRSPLFHALEEAPVAMAVSDLNEDTLPDIALLASSTNSSASPASLLAANLDADALPDLISADGNTEGAFIHLNSPQARHIEISTLTNLVAGTRVATWLIPVDAWGHGIVDFEGTLRLTASDPESTFNTDIALTASDRGVRALSGYFYQPGTHSLEGTDRAHSGGSGSLSGIAVTEGIRFTLFPTNQAVAVGDTAMFQAGVSSPAPVHYQWWQVVSTNLVRNGGFERPVSATNDLPAFWGVAALGGSVVGRDRVNRTEGDYACRLIVDSAGSYGGVAQNILVPGKSHLVRFQARREWASAGLQAYSSYSVPLRQPLSPTWRSYTFYREATNRYFELGRLVHESHNGLMCIDDVQVYQLELLPQANSEKFVFTPTLGGSRVTFVLTASNAMETAFSPLLTLSITRPPEVRLLAPLDWSFCEMAESLEIRADAADPDGTVHAVEFLVDGQIIGDSTTAPYAATWLNPTPGLHLVVAQGAGQSGSRVPLHACPRLCLRFAGSSASQVVPFAQSSWTRHFAHRLHWTTSHHFLLHESS